jgi:hypothetical protein
VILLNALVLVLLVLVQLCDRKKRKNEDYRMSMSFSK